MKSSFIKIGLISVVLSTAANICFAQGLDIEAIKAKANEMKQAKALLNDIDPNIRLAALETMFASEDLALRELAYSAGLASDDDVVRSITVRKRFTELRKVAIELSLPEKPSENDKKLFDEVSGVYIATIESVDVDSGYIDFIGGSGSLSGLLLRATLNFRDIKMELNDDSIFEGVYVRKGAKLEAKLELH